MPTQRQIGFYFPFLEGLRAVAALYVVFHHAWMDTWNTVYGYPKPGGWSDWAFGWLAYGHAAVTVFITISGFCLMLPVIAKQGVLASPWGFFRRRATRILPPYYAAVLLGLLVSPVVGWPVSIGSVVSHLLLIHNWNQHIFGLNGPLWSVATECQIYLFFPVLVWLAHRWGLWFMLATASLVGFGLFGAFGYLGGFERDTHYLAVFALGMCAARVAATTTKPSPTLAGALAAVGVVLAVACYHRWGLTQILRTDAVVGLTTVALLIACVQKTAGLDRLFAWKPLAWLGTFSYSLYLVHQPLQALISKFVVEPLAEHGVSAFCLRVATVPFILWAAYQFFRLCEEPFLRKTPAGAKTIAIAEEIPV